MYILFTVLHMFLTVLFEKFYAGHHCTLLVCPPHQLALPGSFLSRLQARRQEKCGKTDPQRSSIWPSLDQVTTSAPEGRTHRVYKHKEHILV